MFNAHPKPGVLASASLLIMSDRQAILKYRNYQSILSTYILAGEVMELFSCKKVSYYALVP
ncbi:hypothetical protein VspSTUT11_38480 [Vibrio sp. STUT-A11]|nr:hypothetical protein VspSTUT11_38480 [Vibrio sp. STUT-A11]